jgi:4-carboxymuconolactone decarboxylase
MTDTTKPHEPSGAERMFGDFAPALVHFTDDILFGEMWSRTELSAKPSPTSRSTPAGPKHLPR